MTNQAFIHAFMDSFQKNIPPALSSVSTMLSEHVAITLERVLKKMHLVTREEFDIQMGLLKQAQRKLADIEKQVAELEKTRAGE